MKIIRYTYTKQRYIPPIVEVLAVYEDSDMLQAAASATGENVPSGDGEGGNERSKEGFLWDLDDGFEDINDYEY